MVVDSNSSLMAAGVPVNVNGWVYQRTLGSGGFGAVYLYHNEVSVQYDDMLFVAFYLRECIVFRVTKNMF